MDHFLAHPPLTLAAVYPYLRARLETLLPLQIDAPGSPDHGGLFSPEYGMADAKLSGYFVAVAAYCALAAERLGATAASTPWLERATLAARHLQASQRPSGNLDLLSVNYDSAPDTGFTVQQLCTLFELAGAREEPAWRALLAEVERFVRATVPGLRTGGFHTPNHRWVMVSALVQARAAFPDLDVADVVNEYLAETFDCDEEGFFIERSVGVYDAVNDRSLLFIGQYWDSPEAAPTAARNLELNLHLLHSDGTADTGLSRRQDYGSRTVPTQLIDCYLAAHAVAPTPRFAAAAHHFWDRAVFNQTGSDRANHFAHDIGWIAYGLLRYGDPPLVDVDAAAKLPDNYARFFPVNRIWRVRRDRLSASFYGDTTRLLTLTMGQAELTSLKISQTYFGQYTGRFIGQEFAREDGALLMRSRGDRNPRRPGYELPLGRPVANVDWQRTMPERALRWLPHPLTDLRVTEAADADGIGFDLHVRTLDGTDGVTFQIALDFPPGGIWETTATRTHTVAGQVIFLQEGFGAMRYGNDVIRLGPGVHAHGTWHMRDAEPAPDHVRVLLTLRVPVDFVFAIRGRRGG
jgi:hypothetical protein